MKHFRSHLYATNIPFKSLTMVNVFADINDVADQEAILGIICNSLTDHTTPLTLTLSSIRVYPSILPFIQSNNCLGSLTLHLIDMPGTMFSKLCFNLVEWAGRFLTEEKEPPLHSINFTNCKLGATDWQSLNQVFSTHTQLRKVDLSGNALGGEAIITLLPSLATCSQLTELNISGNASTSGLYRNTHNANTLMILGQTLPSWPSLRILKLTGFPLSNGKGNALFDGFQALESPVLEALAVSGVDSEASGRLKTIVKDVLVLLKELDFKPSAEIPPQDARELENIVSGRLPVAKPSFQA